MRVKSARIFATGGLLLSAWLGPALRAQTPQPLTNADVIKMVKGGLPESVIVSSIQSRPAKFDVSPDGLIALHRAGVTPGEMDAVMAASAKGPAGASVPRPPEPGANAPPTADSVLSASKSRMPRVTVTQGNSSQEMKLEKTQLAETKTKPSSMKSLAGDSAVTQAMQSGVNTATFSAASHMSSGIGGSAVEQAGSIFSGMMSHRTPTVTYVWGVPGAVSANVLKSSTPTFFVDFARTAGVTPDEYVPAIVKLTPAQNTCRIAGATQGKEDVRSSPAADWEIYSHFLEERVASTPQKLGPGEYKIAANAELLPGEYGVVLRPISKDKRFSGGDVARAQGDGLMFDAIWTFRVSDEAQ